MNSTSNKTQILIGALLFAVVFILIYWMGANTGGEGDDSSNEDEASELAKGYSGSDFRSRARGPRRKSFSEEESISFPINDLLTILEGPRRYRVNMPDFFKSDFPVDEDEMKKWLEDSSLGKTLTALKVAEQDQLVICKRTRAFAEELIKVEKKHKKLSRKKNWLVVYDVTDTTYAGQSLQKKYAGDIDEILGKKKSKAFQALAAIDDFQWGRNFEKVEFVSEIAFVKKDGGITLFTSKQSGIGIRERDRQRWEHYLQGRWK